jgi:hypothetical protein
LRLLELLLRAEIAACGAVGWAAALDRYRQRFPSSPLELTNPVLIGTSARADWRAEPGFPIAARRATATWTRSALARCRWRGKDLDRLRHMLLTLPKHDRSGASAAGRPRPAGPPSFPDTLTWFEIFGGDATVLEQWQAVKISRPAGAAARPPARRAPARTPPDTTRRTAVPDMAPRDTARTDMAHTRR